MDSYVIILLTSSLYTGINAFYHFAEKSHCTVGVLSRGCCVQDIPTPIDSQIGCVQACSQYSKVVDILN